MNTKVLLTAFAWGALVPVVPVSAQNGTHCSTTPIPILDNQTNTGSVVVTGTGSITDVTVDIEANHTWVDDIVFTLVAPNGASVVLLDYPICDPTFCCSSDDVDALLSDAGTGPVHNTCNPIPPAISGTLMPTDPLSVLKGGPCDGTWQLRAFDGATGDQGQVNQWCVNLACTPDGSDVPATSAGGVIALIALFMGVSVLYLARRRDARGR